MSRTLVRKTIDAPARLIFETIANAEKFASIIPDIARVEYLSEQTAGVGTRFKETRVMKGRESVTELEVTEYDPPDRIRLVADSHGTIWESLFTVWEAGGQSHLEMILDARPYTLLPRLLNPLMKRVIRSAIEKDMDAVKAYCESHPG